MTRQDYVKVAKAIAALNRDYTSFEARGMLLNVAAKLADVFARDNTRFDRTTFLKACDGE